MSQVMVGTCRYPKVLVIIVTIVIPLPYDTQIGTIHITYCNNSSASGCSLMNCSILVLYSVLICSNCFMKGAYNYIINKLTAHAVTTCMHTFSSLLSFTHLLRRQTVISADLSSGCFACIGFRLSWQNRA